MSLRALTASPAVLLATATLAAVGLALAPAAGATAHATGQATARAERLDYVALGDSYSAGSGVLPLDLGAPLLCARSAVDYPHVLAAATGARLTDVTCGGADTGDFTKAQFPGVAPQVDALGPGTDLVTLTIGGNDSNTFVDAVLACGSAGVLGGGHGSPCKDRYGSSFTDTIDTKTYPAVRAAVQAVRDRAPGARVAVLGYPWIMPSAFDPSCFLKLPIASGDVPYMRDLQTHLDAAVRRAAREAGAVFVDLSGVSEGHDACAPVGTRWIEPVLFGTTYVPVHPNALGERRMAEQVRSVLGLPSR